MFEYCEDLFNQMNMKTFKTIPLEGIYRTTKRINRICKTCSKYNIPEKDMCIPIGIIANPDCPCCSFYKDKKVKSNNIRSYRSLK